MKYRKALLDKMVIKIIEETAEGIPERYAIEMEVLGMEIFRRYPEIKKELWCGEFWSDGYYVVTVGKR